MIFPINTGYWTVLIVDTQGKKVRYYDPIGIENNDNVVCSQLFMLLRREVKIYEDKDIDKTRWQRLEFERINEFEAYDYIDSPLYVIRQAFRLTVNKDIQVRPEILPEYRKKLLTLLFKYGESQVE